MKEWLLGKILLDVGASVCPVGSTAVSVLKTKALPGHMGLMKGFWHDCCVDFRQGANSVSTFFKLSAAKSQ